MRYHGAYPCGFLERARRLLPVLRTTPVLHACGGTAKLYRDPVGPAWDKLCPNDVTCDLVERITLKDGTIVVPDLVWNVRTNGLPDPMQFPQANVRDLMSGPRSQGYGWHGILIDPPYTPQDADEYAGGRAELPDPKKLIVDAMDVLVPGGRVGILHYQWPRPPQHVRSIAYVDVVCGFGNKARAYSVFEKE